MTESPVRPAVIVAVAGDDDRYGAVIERAANAAQEAGSALILWDRDAGTNPWESPLPTAWSGEGDEDQFGDRLGPNDLVAAGREPLARRVGELRKRGVDAWAWLPPHADARHLADYAADQSADLILVPADDADLITDLRDLARGSDGAGEHHVRVEAVPA
jgi:hypothetical protein